MKPRLELVAAWAFASESNPGKVYQTLLWQDQSTSCDCPGWTKRVNKQTGQRTCKHVRFVEMGIANQHCQSWKDYTNPTATPKPQTAPLQVPTGRSFDFAE